MILFLDIRGWIELVSIVWFADAVTLRPPSHFGDIKIRPWTCLQIVSSQKHLPVLKPQEVYEIIRSLKSLRTFSTMKFFVAIYILLELVSAAEAARWTMHRSCCKFVPLGLTHRYDSDITR